MIARAKWRLKVRQTGFRVVLVALAFLAGCRMLRKANGEVGSYQLVVVGCGSEVIRLDRISGATWRLAKVGESERWLRIAEEIPLPPSGFRMEGPPRATPTPR
jgi:hypothetical protein